MQITTPVPDFKEFALYTYSLASLTKTQKVMFFYALNGRNNKPGLAEKLHLDHVGISVILCSSSSSKELEEFFSRFKIKFSKISVYREGI